MPVSRTAGGKVITAARSVRGNLSVCELYHNRPLQSNTFPRQAGPLAAGPHNPTFYKKPKRGSPQDAAAGGMGALGGESISRLFPSTSRAMRAKNVSFARSLTRM